MTRLLAWSADTTTGAANRHMWDQARAWAACSNPGDMNQVCFAAVGRTLHAHSRGSAGTDGAWGNCLHTEVALLCQLPFAAYMRSLQAATRMGEEEN
jgi:hypothetical protein